MNALGTSDAAPKTSNGALLIWVGALATVSLLIIAVAIADLPAPILAVLPFLMMSGIFFMLHTPAALCVVAFSIVPLGIIQVEIASVTISFPEALILLLFSKEAVLFVLRGEKISPAITQNGLALYLGAGLTGLLTALYQGNGLIAGLQDSRQFLEFILLYLLVVHRVKDRRLIKFVLASYILGAGIIALHGIVERFTGIGIPGTQLVSDLVYHEFIRSGSVYGATALGALMVLALGSCIGLILSSKNTLIKVPLSGLCVVFLVAAVFTNTRASWLAIMILLIFVFVSVRKRPGLIVAAIVGTLIFSIILGPVIYNRMAMLEVSKKERSLLERVQYYTVAWHIFRSHPLLGLGWGSYYDMKSILINGYYTKVEAPEVPKNLGEEKVTVHSAYLQILVKTGLAGLLSFFVLLIHWGIWIFKERRTIQKDELDHNLFIGVTGALVGYLFHATGENFFQWPVMSQSFWMLLGLSTLMGYALVSGGKLGSRENCRSAENGHD